MLYTKKHFAKKQQLEEAGALRRAKAKAYSAKIREEYRQAFSPPRRPARKKTIPSPLVTKEKDETVPKAPGVTKVKDEAEVPQVQKPQTFVQLIDETGTAVQHLMHDLLNQVCLHDVHLQLENQLLETKKLDAEVRDHQLNECRLKKEHAALDEFQDLERQILEDQVVELTEASQWQTHRLCDEICELKTQLRAQHASLTDAITRQAQELAQVRQQLIDDATDKVIEFQNEDAPESYLSYLHDSDFHHSGMQDDVDLAEGWICVQPRTTGKVYYYNQETGVSQWTQPISSISQSQGSPQYIASRASTRSVPLASPKCDPSLLEKPFNRETDDIFDYLHTLMSTKMFVFDGGMGTMNQNRKLEEEHFRGTRFADFEHSL